MDISHQNQKTAVPAPPASSRSSARSGGSGIMPWRMLTIVSVIFGMSIFIWAGISFGYIPYVNSQISQKDADLKELSSSITPEQKESFIEFYSQLYNIDYLSRNHLYPSVFFKFLETETYPSVLITSTDVKFNKGEASIIGLAKDYSTLTDQLESYKNDPNVISVSLDTSSLNKSDNGGGVNFSLKIIFINNFFLNR